MTVGCFVAHCHTIEGIPQRSQMGFDEVFGRFFGARHHMAAAVGALDALSAEGSIQPSGGAEAPP